MSQFSSESEENHKRIPAFPGASQPSKSSRHKIVPGSMPEITVCYYKKKILLPLNKNGYINSSTLKQYCPKALGLCYTDEDGKTHALALSQEEIIINPKINTYDVHVIEDSALINNISGNKRKRIDEILAKIHGGKKNNENLEPDEPRENQSSKSPKRLTKAGKQRKTVHLGWLHRSTPTQKYQQMKKPMGGIKDLKLDSSHQYSVNEIKEMAVQDFTCDENRQLMRECTIKLVFFDGRPIQEFNNTNGQPCGLWNYCKSKNVSSYRLNLYILTTLKMDDEETKDGVQDEDIVTEDKASNESQQVDYTMVEAASTDSNEKDDIRIFYHYIKESKYSGEKSVTELEKDELYLQIFSEHHSLDLSINEFEPLDQGYSISRIEKGGRVLLQIDIDDNFEKSFHFPSADDKVFGNIHYIVHDVDVVQGSCKGQFGLGIIPNCTDSCKTIFTWTKNGEIFKQGQFLYWINLMHELPDQTPSWSVSVNCQRSNADTESVPAQTDLKVAADRSVSDLLTKVSSIPSIKREDLAISKIILGAGAQGKIRRGTWLGTDVAVKSVKLVSTNLKLISRELNVSNMIRHPNIIQTMAVCPEPRQLHIVMELFRSNPLSDVLFDDDIKEEYHLNIEKKNFIGNQICQAISYLHCQANAMIHGDIKPDNILLNLDGIVKLCDLGLSKFTQMATALRSTLGTKTNKGTTIFMAPEMFLQKSDATLFSDVWALACTIIELYSAMPIWNLDDDHENHEMALREKLTNEVISELTALPTELEGIIKTCFSHDISKRPMAIDLQQVFNILPQ